MTVVQKTVHQTVKTDTHTAVKQVNVVEDCIRSIMVFELKEEDEEILSQKMFRWSSERNLLMSQPESK